MNEVEPLSMPRMVVGLIAAAVVGCIVYSSLEAVSALLGEVIATLFFDFVWKDTQFWEMLGIYVSFGTPVAIVACLLIGLPVWMYADSMPLRSRRSSLKIGAGVGVAIGLLFLAFNIVMGVQTYLDDSASFNAWRFGYQVIRDGMPTAIGWLYKLQTLVFFTIAGGLAGLAARRVALPR